MFVCDVYYRNKNEMIEVKTLTISKYNFLFVSSLATGRLKTILSIYIAYRFFLSQKIKSSVNFEMAIELSLEDRTEAICTPDGGHSTRCVRHFFCNTSVYKSNYILVYTYQHFLITLFLKKLVGWVNKGKLFLGF
jgi:hypothetical protein